MVEKINPEFRDLYYLVPKALRDINIWLKKVYCI